MTVKQLPFTAHPDVPGDGWVVPWLCTAGSLHLTEAAPVTVW